jgi:hypothetical protein
MKGEKFSEVRDKVPTGNKFPRKINFLGAIFPGGSMHIFILTTGIYGGGGSHGKPATEEI